MPSDKPLIKIEKLTRAEYGLLLSLWEASVRATHDFLSENDIKALSPQVAAAFPQVELWGAKDDNRRLLGFVGVAQARVEMLFIAPESQGKGLGKKLLNFAVKSLGACELDVNEQNPKAIGFYKHLGFESFARSELDGQGNAFPLLHLRLKNNS